MGDRLDFPGRNRRGCGALDAHMGAVGASVAQGILTRIMGTSSCDIMVARQRRGRRTLYQGNLRPGGRFGASGIVGFRSRTVGFRRHLRLVQEDAGMDTEISPGEARQKVLDGMLVGTHP